MKKLEITYQITGFDRILYDRPPSWENCEFSMSDVQLAVLRIWEDEIQNSSELELARDKIKQRMKSFVLAMQFRLMLPLTCVVVGESIINDDNDTICISEALIIGDQAFCNDAPSAPPQEMPSLPLSSERWVLTLAETHMFGSYVEEWLKRQYLVIEELWEEFKDEFDEAEHDLKKNIKLIRDFVSHPVCENDKILQLISKDLPLAIQSGDKRAAKFLPNDAEHRNYVARFEVKSREFARRLVERKISQMEPA